MSLSGHVKRTRHSTCSILPALLDLVSPHPIWSAAGRDSVSTKRATYVLWLLLGCYNTGERLFKMGKVRTQHCLLCAETTEADSPVIDNREHFLLSCPALHDIRQDFLSQFGKLSLVLNNYMEDPTNLLVCLLDPYSPIVPEDLRLGWTSEEKVYETSRNFCYAMHNKSRISITEQSVVTSSINLNCKRHTVIGFLPLNDVQ